MAEFVMMVGVSGAGKSTIAKIFARDNNGVVVSTDDIREEFFGNANIQRNNDRVFKEAHKRIKAFLKEDCTVIFDATNLSSKRRAGFLKELNHPCKKICIVVVAECSEVIHRQKLRDRVVPTSVVEKQIKSFECPYYYEGWDRISLINTGREFDIFNLLMDLRKESHDNHHHLYTIGEHMIECRKNAPNFLKEAALYHDIGKGVAKTYYDSRGNPSEEAHYYNHNNIGSYIYLTSFYTEDLTEEQRDSVLFNAALISHHMRLYNLPEDGIEKLKKRFGYVFVESLIELNKCDIKSH